MTNGKILHSFYNSEHQCSSRFTTASVRKELTPSVGYGLLASALIEHR